MGGEEKRKNGFSCLTECGTIYILSLLVFRPPPHYVGIIELDGPLCKHD